MFRRAEAKEGPAHAAGPSRNRYRRRSHRKFKIERIEPFRKHWPQVREMNRSALGRGGIPYQAEIVPGYRGM